jgi:hypothetical protein
MEINDIIKIKEFIHWFNVNGGDTLSLYSKSTMRTINNG